MDEALAKLPDEGRGPLGAVRARLAGLATLLGELAAQPPGPLPVLFGNGVPELLFEFFGAGPSMAEFLGNCSA